MPTYSKIDITPSNYIEKINEAATLLGFTHSGTTSVVLNVGKTSTISAGSGSLSIDGSMFTCPCELITINTNTTKCLIIYNNSTRYQVYIQNGDYYHTGFYDSFTTSTARCNECYHGATKYIFNPAMTSRSNRIYLIPAIIKDSNSTTSIDIQDVFPDLFFAYGTLGADIVYSMGNHLYYSINGAIVFLYE